MYLPFCVDFYGQKEYYYLFFSCCLCKLFQDLFFDIPKEKDVAAAIGRD